MPEYLPARDSTGRLIDLMVTARAERHAAAGPAQVGRVIAISGGRVTLSFPVTEEAVLDEAGAPTGRYRALTFPTLEEEEFASGDVTLWG